MALSRWYCAGKSLVLTFSSADGMERTESARGNWGVLARPPVGEFASVSAGGGLNLSIWTIENFVALGNRK